MWLRENYPSLLIRPIKDLLDDHELVVKTATDEDIPFEGYVEIDFQLDGYESDNYLRVPFLVTAEKISEPIIGFNVIQEIACNPHQYGLDFEDLVKILAQSMPTAKDVPAVIDLLNDRSIVDLCQVKTTTRGITIPPRKNLIIKCYANTGHVDCRQPVMFEPDPEGCWPEGLEVSESILSIPRGSSCHINIPVANTSDYEIYVHPKTIIGSLQLISSITPLDGKLVSSPTVEPKEEQAGVESKVKESMEGESFLVESKIKESTHTEKWLPPVDLSHLEESQRKQVEELLREECETFSKDKDDIGNVPSVQMEINLSDTRPVQKDIMQFIVHYTQK